MSGSTRKKAAYRKFDMKDPTPSGGMKARAASDSVASVKLLEKKYRTSPIALPTTKSKVVAKIIVAKRPPAAGAARDAASPTPTKKAFFLGGKPVAFQG